jgi:DNA helicase-4
LVDEFQDISGPRAELVKAVARLNPDTTVFCVGDDWQSIYRFAGSDIRYSKDFEKVVAAGTTVVPRNYPITSTRAPAGTRDASHPAPRRPWL